jgi:hypothetical protein
MLWRGNSPSEGTQRNRQRRGTGTWGEETMNLAVAERQKFRRRRGSGTWGHETRNMYQDQRRRLREARRNKNPLYRLLMG